MPLYVILFSHFSACTKVDIIVQGTYGFLHDVYTKKLFSMKGYRYIDFNTQSAFVTYCFTERKIGQSISWILLKFNCFSVVVHIFVDSRANVVETFNLALKK